MSYYQTLVQFSYGESIYAEHAIYLESQSNSQKNDRLLRCLKELDCHSFAAADCEWKAQAGNICVASFDWRCSGICRSVERIMEVHQRCGEGENTLWTASF